VAAGDSLSADELRQLYDAVQHGWHAEWRRIDAREACCRCCAPMTVGNAAACVANDVAWIQATFFPTAPDPHPPPMALQNVSVHVASKFSNHPRVCCVVSCGW